MIEGIHEAALFVSICIVIICDFRFFGIKACLFKSLGILCLFETSHVFVFEPTLFEHVLIQFLIGNLN